MNVGLIDLVTGIPLHIDTPDQQRYRFVDASALELTPIAIDQFRDVAGMQLTCWDSICRMYQGHKLEFADVVLIEELKD
ncbi:MAG: hypothetical protein WD294_04280 [Phycisphaeraceae bacterium]